MGSFSKLSTKEIVIKFREWIQCVLCPLTNATTSPLQVYTCKYIYAGVPHVPL